MCFIIIRKEGEFIKVEVADNGAGMSEERLQEVMTEDTNWERGLILVSAMYVSGYVIFTKRKIVFLYGQR